MNMNLMLSNKYYIRAIINGYESELDNILHNSNDIMKKYK
jgi:hypothetical protein